jgi:hypothetical protein
MTAARPYPVTVPAAAVVAPGSHVVVMCGAPGCVTKIVVGSGAGLQYIVDTMTAHYSRHHPEPT